MPDLARSHHRSLDPHADVDALPEPARVKRHAEGVRVDERVEGPAERQVVPHPPTELIS